MSIEYPSREEFNIAARHLASLRQTYGETVNLRVCLDDVGQEMYDIYVETIRNYESKLGAESQLRKIAKIGSDLVAEKIMESDPDIAIEACSNVKMRQAMKSWPWFMRRPELIGFAELYKIYSIAEDDVALRCFRDFAAKQIEPWPYEQIMSNIDHDLEIARWKKRFCNAGNQTVHS